MTSDEARRVMGRLKGGFDKNLHDDTYGIWLEELDPLDFSPAYAAARELVKSSKFFPSIAEFIAEYRRHTDRQAGPREHVECRFCEGGWVLYDLDRNEWMPCQRCRVEQFGHWQRGETPPTAHKPNAARFTRREHDAGPDRIDDVAGRVARLKALLQPTRPA